MELQAIINDYLHIGMIHIIIQKNIDNIIHPTITNTINTIENINETATMYIMMNNDGALFEVD